FDLFVSISCDGYFQINMHVLILLKQLNLSIKVFILYNAALGMVRQWQESFYVERYSESLLDMNPDFVKLEESYGIKGMKVRKEEQVESALDEIFAYKGTFIVYFRFLCSENVFTLILT